MGNHAYRIAVSKGELTGTVSEIHGQTIASLVDGRQIPLTVAVEIRRSHLPRLILGANHAILRETARGVSQEDPKLIVRELVHSQVELAVAIEVGRVNPVRLPSNRRTDIQRPRQLPECTITTAVPNRHRVGIAADDGQVEDLIVVKEALGHPRRSIGNRQSHRRCERTVAAAEREGHNIFVVCRCGQIRNAVAVEVARNLMVWITERSTKVVHRTERYGLEVD